MRLVLIVATLTTIATSPPRNYSREDQEFRLTQDSVHVRVLFVLINTALESPLGQIAMIPLLAWIANSAPPQLKATFFAVMASFTNLALAASQLGTQYLNQIFIVKRGDYSEVGALLIVAAILTLAVPLVVVAGVRLLGLRTA